MAGLTNHLGIVRRAALFKVLYFEVLVYFAMGSAIEYLPPDLLVAYFPPRRA